MATRTAEQLLTLRQVASLLGIGLKTAQRRVYSGEISWVNVASHGAKRASIRVRESAVAAYQDRQSRGGAA